MKPTIFVCVVALAIGLAVTAFAAKLGVADWLCHALGFGAACVVIVLGS